MFDIHKVIGKIPFKPKRGFVLYKHHYKGPYNPLHKQLDADDRPIAGQQPYNAIDDVALRHDICYRDNDNKAGKRKCDEIMLHDLDVIKPKNKREKFDKLLVKGVIKTKKQIRIRARKME